MIILNFSREPHDSHVYKAAKVLAVIRPDRLYFEWTNRSCAKSHHTATILHHGIVHTARFLNDMTKFVTSNGDGQIKVWDILSGDVLHRFTGHKTSVRTISISPDGDLLASGAEDGAVKIWDLGHFLDETDSAAEQQKEVMSKSS